MTKAMRKPDKEIRHKDLKVERKTKLKKPTWWPTDLYRQRENP